MIWGLSLSGAAAAPVRDEPKRGKRGLTATFVEKVRSPGRYGDGNGLYLVVDPSLASRWVLRVQTEGKRRDIGLGGTANVSLAEARDLAHEVRRKAKAGMDPVAVRRAEREGVPTLKDCAKIVHAAHQKTWRNGKHSRQWLKTLETHAYPTIGKRPVNKIETSDILKVLLPIWTQKPETARRVLQRLRTVLDHATAAGHRSGENPCRLVKMGLPKQNDEVEHFAALPYADLPSFIPRLRSANCAGTIKLALEFLILTTCRSGEVRGALIEEFDISERLWTIPAQRMKGGREHVVPLSDRAIEIYEEARKLAPKSDLLFPGRKGQPLSDMTFTMLLRRLKVPATAHGFRSTFRDWVSEETDFPREVAEMALAHAIESKVEAAYRRGRLLEKRRQLMARWEGFCRATTG